MSGLAAVGSWAGWVKERMLAEIQGQVTYLLQLWLQVACRCRQTVLLWLHLLHSSRIFSAIKRAKNCPVMKTVLLTCMLLVLGL